MRTKYKGELKPFARKLKEQYDAGLLRQIEVPGKHIYTFNLKTKQQANPENYPKGERVCKDDKNS